MSISNLPADFGAAGAQNNMRGFSTLQILLSGVAGSGRSADTDQPSESGACASNKNYVVVSHRRTTFNDRGHDGFPQGLIAW
jgi:hypothetical protein